LATLIATEKAPNLAFEKRLDALDKALREIWRAVALLFSF
jgi:hypothetical protein